MALGTQKLILGQQHQSGFVFVCIVVSVKFVRVPSLVPYVLVVPDVRNVMLFWRAVCFARSHLPIFLNTLRTGDADLRF